MIPLLLNGYIKKKKLSDKTLTDFEFIAVLGKVRNYKSNCAICLIDKMMGTTCTCGHTEITVFRPCEHSLCTNPCFYNFIKSKGKELKREKFTVKKQEKTLTVYSNRMNIKELGNFPCPLCRINVDSVFRAEEVWMKDKKTLEKWTRQVVQMLLNELDIDKFKKESNNNKNNNVYYTNK